MMRILVHTIGMHRLNMLMAIYIASFLLVNLLFFQKLRSTKNTDKVVLLWVM